MKIRTFKILFLLLFVIKSSIIVAQTDANQFGKISLSVVMPENLEGLSVKQLSQIETKIISIVTANGLGASGFNHNFVIFPKFEITKSEVYGGGMEDIYNIGGQITLVIKQTLGNITFSTISKDFNASGRGKAEAITNSISKLNTNDQDFQVFIEKGKTRIIQYYESKCTDLIVQADGMAKRQSYEEALMTLLSIPSEVSCYSKVQAKSIEIYKNYQSYRCGALLQQAQSDASQNDYSSSLSSLSQIDPSSKCGQAAKALMGKIEAKIDADNRQQFEATMMVYKDAVQLEKQRINAVRDIAVEYARNQPKPATNNYLILIR